MARPFHLPPSASSLSASLRDLGYSLEAAIADLIDNSISAEATEIQIFCNLASEVPCLAILDNGRGMDSDEVIAAMKHGSKDPKEERSLRDLGRFGLGLKTASFSQCRQLTVISSQNGKLAGAEWDLKKVEDEDEWTVSILEDDDFPHQPFLDQLAGTGSIIIWRDLDRLFEDQTGQKRDEIVNENSRSQSGTFRWSFTDLWLEKSKAGRRFRYRRTDTNFSPSTPSAAEMRLPRCFPTKQSGSTISPW